ASNNEWLGTHGSNVLQTVEGFTQKVWLNDVAEIGANILPLTQQAWEPGGIWISSGNETDPSGSLRMKDYVTVQPSTQYTISDDSAYNSNIQYIDVHQYSPMGTHITHKRINRGDHTTFTTWNTTGKIRVSMVPREPFVIPANFIDHIDNRIKFKLEQGSVATPMVNAISSLQQVADRIDLKVQELTSVDGEDILVQSDITIEPDRV